MSSTQDLLRTINDSQDQAQFQVQNWHGTFEEYFELVRKTPRVTRTAYQRIYDMILSHGTTRYVDSKKEIVQYKFFSDPVDGGRDAVFGLDVSLMKLVSVFKSAAKGYGTERRVLLLHGPVGSAKSTITRLLKKGVEAYSRTDEGALYTFSWVPESKNGSASPIIDREVPCPMHEEPLTLIPKLKSKHKKTSVIGFLSHVQGDLKQKAHEVGCDMVLPRSAFSQNLPQLLRRHGAADEVSG